ncbi:MAG: FAD-dependent oxidoreductase [Actinomycetota bacterium]
MAEVLVLGGAVCGLATAMMLARDGHDVTVLERDAADVPDTVDAAWSSWERKGVPQFRQAHVLFPRFRKHLEEELPDVNEAFLANGVNQLSFLGIMPPMITDRSPRPGDDKLVSLCARRPFMDWAVTHAARDVPRLTIRRGVQVTELVTGTSAVDSVPHVVGVRTAGGEELGADLVVDAMGRRSKTVEWIGGLGGPPPYEEAEEPGFTYYSRYFRGDALPQYMGPVGMELGTITVLTFWCDNGTWGMVLNTSSGDQPLKQLRKNDVWMSVMRSCPLQAHWADGEPITDVMPMSGQMDKYRRFVVDGKPVVTGLLAVADAWACTNPSAGRGLSVGLGHAVALRDTVRKHLGSPVELAHAFDAVTEEEFKPFYYDQVQADRARVAAMDANREGREPPPPKGEYAQRRVDLFAGVPLDPDIFRSAMSWLSCLVRPDKILWDEELLERSRKVAEDAGVGAGPPMQMPGPTREQLLEIVGG